MWIYFLLCLFFWCCWAWWRQFVLLLSGRWLSGQMFHWSSRDSQWSRPDRFFQTHMFRGPGGRRRRGPPSQPSSDRRLSWLVMWDLRRSNRWPALTPSSLSPWILIYSTLTRPEGGCRGKGHGDVEIQKFVLWRKGMWSVRIFFLFFFVYFLCMSWNSWPLLISWTSRK